MRRHARKHVRAHSVKISPFDQVAFPSAFFTGARAGANPASSTRIHANQVRAHRAIAPQVSPLLCTALTLAHTSCTLMHTHSPSKTLRVLLSPRAVPLQSRRSGPPPPARRGPSTLRRNCRSHGRMRVKEWLDSCGALSTNMQRADIDHVGAGRTLIFCTTRVASILAHCLRALSRCLNARTSQDRTCLGQLLLPGPRCSPSAHSAIPRDRFKVRLSPQ